MSTQPEFESQIAKVLARTTKYTDDAAFERRRRYITALLSTCSVITVVSAIGAIVCSLFPSAMVDPNVVVGLTMVFIVGTLLLLFLLGPAITELGELTPVGESGNCQQALDMVNSSPLAARVRDEALGLSRQLHGWDLKTMEKLSHLESGKVKAMRQLAEEQVACKLLYQLTDMPESANPEVPATQGKATNPAASISF